jgi:hypothetical protein
VGVDVIRRSSKNTLITACGTSSNIPLATAKSMAKLKNKEQGYNLYFLGTRNCSHGCRNC